MGAAVVRLLLTSARESQQLSSAAEAVARTGFSDATRHDSSLECWLIRYVVSIVWGFLLNLSTLSLHGLVGWVFKICVSKKPNLRRDLHWRSGCSGWALGRYCTANSVEGRLSITFLIDGLMRMTHLTLTDVCWSHIQHIYDYNMPSISISIRCLDEPAVCILHSDACAFSRIGVQVF